MSKIKICGITNFEDAKIGVENGADFLGFINYKKSPRFIDIEKAFKIIEKLKNKNINEKDIEIKQNYEKINFVGVFVNKNLDKIVEISQKGYFNIFQLHGDESIDYIKNIKNLKNFSNVKIWKAFRLKDASEIREVCKFNGFVDGFLFDSYQKDNYGGTGNIFDWKILEEIYKRGIPKNKIILSGGIGLENIDEANKQDVFCIDVNSKIEDFPGKKNKEKIIEILKKQKIF